MSLSGDSRKSRDRIDVFDVAFAAEPRQDRFLDLARVAEHSHAFVDIRTSVLLRGGIPKSCSEIP